MSYKSYQEWKKQNYKPIKAKDCYPQDGRELLHTPLIEGVRDGSLT